MSDLTRRRAIKERMRQNVASNPNARLVKNRYDVLHDALEAYYPLIYGSGAGREGIKRFIEDALYADRMLRYATSDYDRENKKKMSQQFQIKELGREVGYDKDLKIAKMF